MKISIRKIRFAWITIPFIALLTLVIINMIRQGNRSPGKALYKEYCANCHMEDGSGLGRIIPPLANSDYLRRNQKGLACLIINGISGEIIVNGVLYNEPMKGLPDLTPGQVNNIINYINSAWENDFPSMTVKEIKEYMQKCDPYSVEAVDR